MRTESNLFLDFQEGGGPNQIFFAPPPRKNSRGGQNNSRGGQIIFHSFTEEALDQGGKFMSLFPQTSYKNCLRGKSYFSVP